MGNIIFTLTDTQLYYALALLTLIGFVCIGLAISPNQTTPPLIRLQKHMGLTQIPTVLFFAALLLWVVLFMALFFGLLAIIWEVLSPVLPQAHANDEATKDWRIGLVKLAALTATLGAVVALPFTVIRITLTQEQTNTAQKQTLIAKEALFNDKINAAVSDLHAQRQITKWVKKQANNGWEDDIVRRNGAIDRLYGLAQETPSACQRIARLLSVYVKELSKKGAYPAETPPDTKDPEILREWANALEIKRSDMQYAAQVLGKLQNIKGHNIERGDIDLTAANLQKFDLTGLNYKMVSFKKAQMQGVNLNSAQMQGAGLIRAQMQGADLIRAQMQAAYLISAKMQGAELISAKMQGADLDGAKFDAATNLTGTMTQCAAVYEIDFTDIRITPEQLQNAFGDATVTLPGGHGPDHPDWPAHWSKEKLDHFDFIEQWDAFKEAKLFDLDP